MKMGHSTKLLVAKNETHNLTTDCILKNMFVYEGFGGKAGCVLSVYNAETQILGMSFTTNYIYLIYVQC